MLPSLPCNKAGSGGVNASCRPRTIVPHDARARVLVSKPRRARPFSNISGKRFRHAGWPHAIEATGAELRFLPPYSPDVNPIEIAFSKFKAFLKKTAARTIEDIWDAIAKGIVTSTPTECQNYFAAGY